MAVQLLSNAAQNQTVSKEQKRAAIYLLFSFVFQFLTENFFFFIHPSSCHTFCINKLQVKGPSSSGTSNSALSPSLLFANCTQGSSKSHLKYHAIHVLHLIFQVSLIKIEENITSFLHLLCVASLMQVVSLGGWKVRLDDMEIRLC